MFLNQPLITELLLSLPRTRLWLYSYLVPQLLFNLLVTYVGLVIKLLTGPKGLPCVCLCA